jgi:hypothetical protein
MALLVGLTAEPIHNDDAHNADDDHGGEDKGEGETLRFHAVLLAHLPSVLFFPTILQGRANGNYLDNLAGSVFNRGIHPTDKTGTAVGLYGGFYRDQDSIVFNAVFYFFYNLVTAFFRSCFEA